MWYDIVYYNIIWYNVYIYVCSACMSDISAVHSGSIPGTNTRNFTIIIWTWSCFGSSCCCFCCCCLIQGRAGWPVHRPLMNKHFSDDYSLFTICSPMFNVHLMVDFFWCLVHGLEFDLPLGSTYRWVSRRTPGAALFTKLQWTLTWDIPNTLGCLEERLDLVAYNLQPHMVSKSPFSSILMFHIYTVTHESTTFLITNKCFLVLKDI